MTDVLGLGGAELLVYAFIYSFTKGDGGLFWGCRDAIADACGISASTLGRAIRALREASLIERCTISGKEGYRCIGYEEAERDAMLGEAPCNDAEKRMPSRLYMERNGIHPVEAIQGVVAHPKYAYHHVGKMGIISMTAEQYCRLLQLVHPEHLHVYISNLEDLILNHGYRCRSPYKTIKKWIYRDAAV